MRSWRLGAVALLSLSSGLPLGLVLTAVPAWLGFAGIDIKTIGVVTLAQAPYVFKFLWAPLLDRYAPGLGRRRGWIVVTQLALAGATGLLAATATEPRVGMIAALTLLIAFASATQDIAIDAYAVEALRPEEQGLAVGARIALYRAAMWIAGNIAITLAPSLGWNWTLAMQAGIYLALLPATLFAPEPEVPAMPPRTLREAVWAPFVGFFRQPRALEIAAFVILYKLADNLAGALVRPFLAQAGYSPVDVGIASGTIGLVGTLVGTFAGGVLTNRLGVGRALWVFGFLQAISNVGYALVASAPPSRPLLYAAMAVESGTSGMGTGAFMVLLMRLTEKRFSATQYALLSSLFALGRTLSGPPAGALADALGWREFFLLTIPCALPGLAMLQRFVPFGARELPRADAFGPPRLLAPLGRGGLAGRALAGVAAGVAVGFAGTVLLASLRLLRAEPALSLRAAMARAAGAITSPVTTSDWLDAVGTLTFGLLAGAAVAAYAAARRSTADLEPAPVAAATAPPRP